MFGQFVMEWFNEREKKKVAERSVTVIISLSCVENSGEDFPQ